MTIHCPVALGLGGLHLVGEDEVRDAAIQNRALAREVHQLGVAAGAQNGLGPLGDLTVRCLKVDFLEGARSQDLEKQAAGRPVSFP